MSEEIDLCKDSDDNGEWSSTNSAAVLSNPLSRKRPRDKEEASNSDAHHPINENDSGSKIATGSAEFVVDLELADEVEVSVSAHKRKRRANNDAAVEATEKDVGVEDAQVTDHRESHQSSIAAALHPVNSDSEQTNRDDGSTNKHSEKPSTSLAVWYVLLSELAEYRKIHGDCNVPTRYNNENTKLGAWVGNQRMQYRWHVKGQASPITSFRIQELESLGFEWDIHGAAWKVRLSELGDYRKLHGHCNVPQNYSENSKLANWVANQRKQYKLHLEGKTSHMTTFRIQELESLGFECKPSIGRGK
jgi:hypothetical protein